MNPTSQPAPSVSGAMAVSLRGYLADAHPYQRLLYWVAILFAASAALHAVVFLIDDRPWAGQASWRQPLAFSVAFVIILPALAWVMTFLPKRPRLGWAVSGTLGAATVWTVILIALQTWRGQPAFFPEDVPFDAGVWTGMQVGIGLIVLPIVVLAGWAFTRMDAPPSVQWAIRSGLVLVLAGLAMGGLMVGEGVRQDLSNVAPGMVQSPVVFGEAGLVVVPHLLALHSIFALSVLTLLLSLSAWPERRRVGIVQVAVLGYTVLITVTLAQALRGDGPFAMTGVLGVLFWIGVALLLGALALTLGRLRPARRHRP